MELLRELSEISSYEPTSGYSADLWKMVRAGKNRQDSLAEWRRLGRTDDSFRRTIKSLKESLLRQVDFGGKEGEAGRMDVWDRYTHIQKLMLVGMKNSAVVLAAQLLVKAQKLEMTEVVCGLSLMLEGHFGGLEVDTRRYLRYKKISSEMGARLVDEIWIRKLQSRLLFAIEKEKDLRPLEDDIEALKAKSNGSLDFVKYRFSVLSLWLKLRNDNESVANLIRETMEAYSSFGEAVSTKTFTSLYFFLIPILCGMRKYADAELALSKALAVTTVGNHNWHLFMLQKACMGLESGKPGIAQAALRQALDAPRGHDNTEIDTRWQKVSSLLDGSGAMDVWQEVMG